jgi:hypothetical protein
MNNIYQAAYSRATLVVSLRLLSYATAAVAFRQKGGPPLPSGADF